MPLVMFLLVERNSSSFSDILLSISCLTWVSSSWHLSTLFSSCSRAPSASERAASSSIFSASNLLDGASSLTDLIHDVLDFIGQSLVLTSDLIKLKDSFLIGGLHTEEPH